MKRALSLLFLLSLVALLLAGCRHSLDLTREQNQVNFGVQSAKINLWREALFRFKRAVALNPNDAMAHNNLAVAYEATGDFDRAKSAYIEALRLDRANPQIQKNYSRFTEFTAKNRKRDKAPGPGETAPAAKSPSAPASPPAPAGPVTLPPPTLPPTTPRPSLPQPQPGGPH